MSNYLNFPGLIDCHVHFREPGLTHKGDMATEAAAAKAGGVLTVCDMPNTVPPTQTVVALKDKIERAKRITDVDIHFFFGATTIGHLSQLTDLWTNPEHASTKRRCCGLKLYLDHSTGNQKADPAIAEEAFKICGELNIPIIAHCEDPKINEEAANRVKGDDIVLHSRLRPPESESESIFKCIDLVRRYETPFHVAHLSTAEGVNLVRQAKKEKLPVTCEVTPHHLFLTIDDYQKLGTLAKMNPPLREQRHLEALWEGIADGTVDCIATDHAPHLLEEKRAGVPLQAPSGVPGVETMLPLLLTVAAGAWPHPHSDRPVTCNLTPKDILRLCFTNPNQIFRLGADDQPRITVDPSIEWTIKGSDIHSRCQWTPYEGWKVKGKVV